MRARANFLLPLQHRQNLQQVNPVAHRQSAAQSTVTVKHAHLRAYVNTLMHATANPAGQERLERPQPVCFCQCCA